MVSFPQIIEEMWLTALSPWSHLLPNFHPSKAFLLFITILLVSFPLFIRFSFQWSKLLLFLLLLRLLFLLRLPNSCDFFSYLKWVLAWSEQSLTHGTLGGRLMNFPEVQAEYLVNRQICYMLIKYDCILIHKYAWYRIIIHSILLVYLRALCSKLSSSDLEVFFEMSWGRARIPDSVDNHFVLWYLLWRSVVGPKLSKDLFWWLQTTVSWESFETAQQCCVSRVLWDGEPGCS